MLIYQSNPIIDIRISRIFNVEMVSNDLMKQQQEKKVKQFEMVQYNVNFMVVEIIEQLKLDFHSLSCTSKFDVTSEILQTIPPKMLLESCIFDIYIYIYSMYMKHWRVPVVVALVGVFAIRGTPCLCSAGKNQSFGTLDKRRAEVDMVLVTMRHQRLQENSGINGC
jgi:hypothetical protein